MTAVWVISGLLKGSESESCGAAAACVKELAGAPRQHKAIAVTVVGNCVHKCYSHWRREVFILCSHSRSSYCNLNVNQRREGSEGIEKPTGNVGDTL